MKRENILINEDYTTKRVVATKFTAPGDVPAFDCSIHFGEGSDDVTLQNCIIQANTLVKCSPEDAYDFETGALIALMKMCGLEKSAKAYAEIFDDTAYGDALIERDKLERLLRYTKDDINKKLEYIKEKDEEIKQLKEKNSDLYNLARKYVDEIDQKDHEIISLKALKLTNESLKKDNEAFRKTCEKLKEENRRLTTERHLLMNKNNELIEKKKDLKKKLNAMYGYIDTDNTSPCPADWDGDVLNIIFLPGRACGKQYKALVELFKKIPKDKVQAAYVAAYKESLIWCTSHPSIRESLDKHTEQINKLTVDSLIEQSRAFTRKCVDEWLYKPPTKREKMWENIKTFTWKGASCVEVNKADVIDFLEDLEKEIPIIRWPSGRKPTSIKPMFDYRYQIKYDKIYFFVDSAHVTYSFDKETSRENVQYVTYLPPMRWDLFKKGRIVVGCTEEEVPEFREKVVRELGNVRMEKYSVENLHCNGPIRVYFHYDKNTNWLKPLLVSGIPRVKVNNHKVVYWEDVR